MLNPAADLAAILGQQDLVGVTVSASVGGNTIDGIFTDAYVESVEAESTVPVFGCTTADVTAQSIVRDTVIQISGISYKVKNIRPSGWGMSLLFLEDQT